jgi:hypothetical protein
VSTELFVAPNNVYFDISMENGSFEWEDEWEESLCIIDGDPTEEFVFCGLPYGDRRGTTGTWIDEEE